METSQLTGEVFDAKYRLYGDMLFRIAMLSLGSREDAEEAVQETFLRLFTKAPSFTGPEHEKRWLIRVITNLCRDRQKSFWRKHVVPLENLQPYCRTQSDMRLTELVVQLPENCKTVIYLYYYENYPVKEISQILHIGESAVKMRLKRGRTLLKLEMEGNRSE